VLWEFACAALMRDGHDPRRVREYPWRVIDAYLAVRAYLGPLGAPDNE